MYNNDEDKQKSYPDIDKIDELVNYISEIEVLGENSRTLNHDLTPVRYIQKVSNFFTKKDLTIRLGFEYNQKEMLDDINLLLLQLKTAERYQSQETIENIANKYEEYQ